jgi:hypothetical protein
MDTHVDNAATLTETSEPESSHLGAYMATAAGVLLGVPLAGAGLALIGARRTERHNRERADELLAGALPPQAGAVRGDELCRLPEPVQRWQRWAGVVGHERIRTVRLRQTGELRVSADAPWMPFTATQYDTFAAPRFLWFASINAGPLPLLHAVDEYTSEGGALAGSLGGWINVIGGDGDEFDQGELLRFLAEIPLFPTAALEKYITWLPIDATSARAVIHDGNVETSAVFSFDETGRPLEVRARRYRMVGGAFSLDLWSTSLDAFEPIDGLMVATRGRAIWHLDSGELEYARFAATDVEFDVTTPFEGE